MLIFPSKDKANREAKSFSDSSCSDHSANVSSEDDDDEESNLSRSLHPNDASSKKRSLPKESEESLRKVLARRETTTVWRLKLIVAFILAGAAAAVSAIAYLYTHNNEVAAYQSAYSRNSQQIFSTVQLNARHKLEAMGSIALQIQAHAISSNSTWPFVTIPFYEEQVQATKSLTDAFGIYWFPIVQIDQKNAWEQYSVENRFWIDHSYAAQRAMFGVDQGGVTNSNGTPVPTYLNDSNVDWFDIGWGPSFRDPNNPNFTLGIASQIFETSNYLNASDHRPIVDYDPIHNPNSHAIPVDYFPQWQAAPMSWYYQSTVNCDYGHYSDFLEQTIIIRDTETAAFGLAWTDSHTPGYLSTVLYPILDRFYKDEVTGEEPQVAGFLAMDIYWQAFLNDILAPDSDPLYVVIQNTCNQSFTYELTGPEAVYIGEGDQSEIKFRDMAIGEVFGKDLMVHDENSTYTGRLLYDNYCPYTFIVSPSQKMQDNYITNKPMIYTIVAVLIFVFTSMIFVLYDCIVERRQQLVMDSAAQSDAIVSSLFPTDVKKRLYEENAREKEREQQVLSKETYELHEFMGIVPEHDEKSSLASSAPRASSIGVSPIASLYPQTTIMFADLVGFTAWSNDRAPSDVFLLLESIYGAFDKVAKRRNVFKVETIGDCYVAVTGIPRPQSRHALIMAKFAQECFLKLRSELERLSDTHLGIGTLALAMRCGLHSGPVTAGVLRGEKARFQLFGDTMNTAARMESNGQPHKIHVSQATADLLIECGKAHWLTKREDKITAKGKGEMQTYWVVTRNANSVESSGGSVSDFDTTNRSLEDESGGSNAGYDEEENDDEEEDDCEDRDTLAELERKLYSKLRPGGHHVSVGASERTAEEKKSDGDNLLVL